MADLHVESRDWENHLGTVCESCGHQREMRYIFPILVQVRTKDGKVRGTKRMCPICVECIAEGKMPSGVNQSDLPWYDPKGNRLNGRKIHVALG